MKQRTTCVSSNNCIRQRVNSSWAHAPASVLLKKSASAATAAISSPNGAARRSAWAYAARGNGVGSSESGACVKAPSCAPAATTSPCCAAHTNACSVSSVAVCVQTARALRIRQSLPDTVSKPSTPDRPRPHDCQSRRPCWPSLQVRGLDVQVDSVCDASERPLHTTPARASIAPFRNLRLYKQARW